MQKIWNLRKFQSFIDIFYVKNITENVLTEKSNKIKGTLTSYTFCSAINAQETWNAFTPTGHTTGVDYILFTRTTGRIQIAFSADQFHWNKIKQL